METSSDPGVQPTKSTLPSGDSTPGEPPVGLGLSGKLVGEAGVAVVLVTEAVGVATCGEVVGRPGVSVGRGGAVSVGRGGNVAVGRGGGSVGGSGLGVSVSLWRSGAPRPGDLPASPIPMGKRLRTAATVRAEASSRRTERAAILPPSAIGSTGNWFDECDECAACGPRPHA